MSCRAIWESISSPNLVENTGQWQSIMYLLRRLVPTSTDVSERKEQAEASKLIRKFGRKGKGKGQFNMPTGIAVSKSGMFRFQRLNDYDQFIHQPIVLF